MKQSHALAYLRQLCCLELRPEIVIREFLRDVQTVIPSGNNCFTKVDEHFLPAEMIFEFISSELAELVPVVVPAYFTFERVKHMSAWFQQHPILSDAAVVDKDFYQSDVYNLIWRPIDMHHCIGAPIIKDGKPFGVLALNRPRAQRPFNEREQALCIQLIPYLAHALTAPNDADIRYYENGTSGTMVLDKQGTILFLCATAQRLLALARYPVVSLHPGKQDTVLRAQLTQLCRNLDAIFQGKEAAPPCLYLTNSQGQFVFRAYWLNNKNNEAGGLVGMTVEHREPWVLKILRGMQTLPLSPTQKEVALLLAQGVSSEQIGQRLHIKPTTVKDHIGKIYLKLDIRQREELLPKLLAGGH